MRTIDADALYAEIKARHDMYLDCEYIGDKARRDELGAFMGDIINAPTVGGWISVKDRLPEESGTVLACDRLGAFYMCEYSQKYKAFNADDNDGDMYSLSTITHWMPLPEPPKEDKP